MRSRVTFGTAVVMILVLIMVALPVSADLPGSGWWGGIQVANLGTAPANIDLVVYASGTTYTESASGIAPGASVNWLTTSIGDPSWRGAAILSASQPIAAVASETNKEISGAGEPGGTARAIYPGVSTPDTKIFFPLVKNNHVNKYTSFFVQNAGAGPGSSTFTADFVDLAGTHYTHDYTNIAPGEMTLIDPADAGFPSGTGVGIGSLTVTSDTPLAGVVNEYKDPGTGNPAKDLMATRGFSDADASNRLVFPIFKNNFGGKHVGIQIMNTGTVAEDVTFTATETFCFSGGETSHTVTQSIDPGRSYTFLGPDILGDGCLAAVEATSSAPIVGVANESWQYTNRFTVYFGFDASAATTEVFAPLYKQVFVDNNTSGLQVQNTSSSPATCTLTWTEVYPDAGDTFVYNDTIAGNASNTYFRLDNATDYPAAKWQGGLRVPNGSNQAVAVVCNQPIVAVVQESRVDNTANQDDGNYEAFNR